MLVQVVEQPLKYYNKLYDFTMITICSKCYNPYMISQIYSGF